MTSGLAGRLPLLLVALVAAGCAPPTAPLYRDYERDPDLNAALLERIEAALASAGWAVAERPLPGVVATEARTVRNWGIYRLKVSLEVVPVGEGHVRVFIHPFREFVTGGRSKLFALDGGLRRSILAPLDTAFAEHGLKAVDSAR